MQIIHIYISTYIYLDPPFGCQISTPNGLFLMVKGPKFQTLGRFRCIHIYIYRFDDLCIYINTHFSYTIPVHSDTKSDLVKCILLAR